jgi:hypothetical protein
MTETLSPAQKADALAVRAVKAAAGDTGFDDLFSELRPNARIMAHALALSTARNPGHTAARELLAAYLQTVLARTMERLTWALVVFTVILAVAAAVPFFHSERPPPPPPPINCGDGPG